jgi:serine/threonine-protein kinase RsbW
MVPPDAPPAGRDSSDQLPRYAESFRMPALAGSIGSARDRARITLQKWGLCADACDRAVLVLSELATNAIRHGSANGCRFEVTLALGKTLRIAVSDADPARRPTPCCPDPIADHGRGLLLVQSLTTEWGTGPHPPAGKTVWAELDTADADWASGN